MKKETAMDNQDDAPRSDLCAVMPGAEAAPHAAEAGATSASSWEGRRTVLIHGTGPNIESWFPQLIRTAQNANSSLGGDPDVIVVVQGPGVASLAADSASAVDIAEALRAGIGVVACGNSLAAAAVAVEDLLPGVAVVPAAISYLARMQWEGAAYVRI